MLVITFYVKQNTASVYFCCSFWCALAFSNCNLTIGLMNNEFERIEWKWSRLNSVSFPEMCFFCGNE